MPGKLLIVDSIATNRIVVKVRLKKAFYDVQQADNAKDALRKLSHDAADLILINGQLDDCDAIEFCKALRKNKPTAYLPIVMISGEDDRVDRLRALKAGANDVLVRPMDDIVLLARIRSLMRTQETAEENQLRERTSEALGFAETAAAFAPPSRIQLATHVSTTSVRWAAILKPMMPYAISPKVHGETLKDINQAPVPDVFVIAVDQRMPETGLRLVAEIRARATTRHAGILVVLDNDDRETLVDAMDLGAHDVMVHGFDPEEMALRISTLVNQKRFSDKLRANVSSGLEAAVTDPLTGLFNRRYALPHLNRLKEQAHKTHRQVGVMLADLDRFKSVNDRFGHAVGDAVLAETARRLREALRPADLVSRIGGEEFLIVMPDANLESVQDMATRLCGLMRNRPIGVSDKNLTVPITMSVGIAMAGRDFPEETIDDILSRADKALYKAKALGRDQVCVSKLVA